MGAFFVFGGNRYGVALSIHRRRTGGVLVYVSEAVRGFYKAVAVGMGGRGHDRQLLFLSQATKTLPMGTAYGIWTGIGALGAVIVGILAFQEPVTVPRLIFVGLLLVGIVGLKLTA